jgi:hypothetical protein
MKPRALWTVLLILAMLVAACGGGDDAAPTTQAPAQQTDSGSEGDGGGDGSSSGGGGFTTDDARADAVGAGADFPIPIPGGWQVDQFALLEQEGASGFAGGVALEYANEDFDELVAFYDEWVASQPDEFVRAPLEGEGVVYTRTSPLTQITISKDFEGSDGLITFLTISVVSE